MNGMRILVTGAAGFIGSHLTRLLVADGHNVVGFDKVDRDVSIITKLGADVVQGDIRDITSLQKTTKGIDTVYHLAAIPNWQGEVSVRQYEAVNVQGTYNVLESCRINRVKKIVFTSSLEAVGPSRDGSPVDENTNSSPTNVYGRTKLKGEKIVIEYYKRFGLKTVIVRLPAVYGPRNMLFLKRYFKAVKNGWYPIIGNGTALMEFCYVKNAVYGLKLAMKKGKPGEIYFISDGQSYQFREVITAIAKQLDVNVKFLKVPVAVAKGVGLSFEVLSRYLKFYPFFFKEMGRPAFSRRSVDWMVKNTLFCDISKAKKNLGYKPSYSLEEGLKENIKWFREVGAL